MSPGLVELELQFIDDGSLKLGHQVVPVESVLAGDIHAAGERDPAVDDGCLDVVAGEPGIVGLPDLDPGFVLEEAMHG